MPTNPQIMHKLAVYKTCEKLGDLSMRRDPYTWDATPLFYTPWDRCTWDPYTVGHTLQHCYSIADIVI